MGLSRQARIITLLVIDTVFFFVELIAGYAVGSLALVADSFHMLNDVLSLVVALYTIKLATSPSDDANSYGWQRAEILGALINGVFLIALCVSIFLEAIGRIVSPPEISNAKVIVVVGSLGLLSNVVGLFLFHALLCRSRRLRPKSDWQTTVACIINNCFSSSPPSSLDPDLRSRVSADPMALQSTVTPTGTHTGGAIQLPDDDDDAQDGPERENSVSDLYQHPAGTRAQIIETAQEFGYGQSNLSQSVDDGLNSIKSPTSGHHRALSSSRRGKRASLSRPKEVRKGSASRVPPAEGQNETLPPVGGSASSTLTALSNGHSKAHSHSHSHSDADHDHDHDHGASHGKKLAANASDAEAGHSHDDGHGHGHGGHGHSHGSMNMRGVFLHVLGDALGNVGVIAAGLVIWFCEGRWTLYFDPAISLVITCIILSSALPLCKSASYILLQGVPSHVSLDAVRQSIVDCNGVDSVHELHIWQLSESTVVASVHVLIAPGVDYMAVANGIRQRMHSHGIHSVTIQPEFYPDESAGSQNGDACLIRCPPEECQGDTCCPPVVVKADGEDADEAAH